MRHENKFVFPETLIDSVYKKIMMSKYFFSEIFTERRVNNIYLDTMTYKNLKDNLKGLQNRIKHRIRWYGDDFVIGEPILEYKIKHGELGYKEYYALPGFQFNKTFDYDKYLETIKNSEQARTPNYEIILNDLSVEIPSLFNSYLRRYFLSIDGNFRITLDKNIIYKSIDRKFFNAFSFSENKIVVELKYNNENILKACQIIQDLGFRISRNSKYVIGMKAIYYNDFNFDFN